MAVFPDSSSASLLQGAWFVFRIDGHCVHAWFSVMTGRSRIFIDGECVRVGRCLRPRGQFEIPFRDSFLTVSFAVARQGRLFVTLRSPNGAELSQCAGFQVPRWAWAASVVLDLLSAYFLMVNVYRDTLSPWLALITFLVVVFALTSLERCVFGKLRIMETGTLVPDLAD